VTTLADALDQGVVRVDGAPVAALETTIVVDPSAPVIDLTLAQGPPGPPGATGPAGVPGAAGATGPAGLPGPGVPVGGTAGQLLAKTTGADYATTWVAPPPKITVGPTAPSSPAVGDVWIDTGP
jgi:hypothetical protein